MVRRYHLNYTTNAFHTQVYLQNIALEGECASPIDESYPNGLIGTLPATSCPQLPSGTTPFVQYAYTPDANVDGNGNPVVQTISQESLSPPAVPYQPTGITQSNPWQPSDAPHVFVDVNGDAKADLVYGPLNGDHQPMICDPNCFTDPVTGEPVTGPYGMYVDYSPPLDQTGENFFLADPSDASNGANATPWEVAPGSSEVVFGDWLPTGKPSWLVAPLGSPTFQVFTPNVVPGNTNQTYVAAEVATFSLPPGVRVPAWTVSNATDVDGDGLVDMQMVPDNTNGGWTYLTAKDRNGVLHPFARTLSESANAPINMPSYAQGPIHPAQAFMADMDGDGLSDYVVAYWQQYGIVHAYPVA